MLAVSIFVARRGKTVNAAIADHVPVAELIPHLVEDISPGEQWVMHRSVGQIRPEHSLDQAGVLPGELLTLDVAAAPAPPMDATEELTGAVGKNHAPWVLAALVSLISWRSAPLWHPLDFHRPSSWSTLELVTVGFSMLVAGAMAAGSLRDPRWSYLAPVVAFGAGLHVNVVTACACAALMVWRAGPPRIVTILLLIFAFFNPTPSFTLLLALIALSFAGQLAIALARIRLPKVPATGIFSQPVSSSAGSVVEVHSSLVVALCVVICACVVQISPWGHAPSGWTISLLMCLCVLGVSARGTRPVHATALACMTAFIGFWLALQLPYGIALLAVAGIPALRITSPIVGRIIDWVEMLAFAAAVPLAVYATGIFSVIRGIG